MVGRSDGSDLKSQVFYGRPLRDIEGRVGVGLVICVCLRGRNTHTSVSVCVFPSLRPQSDLSNRPSQRILQPSAHALPFGAAPSELPLPLTLSTPHPPVAPHWLAQPRGRASIPWLPASGEEEGGGTRPASSSQTCTRSLTFSHCYCLPSRRVYLHC